LASSRLTIGDVARRTGVATSALRFYERRGLIISDRTDSGQRRYRPDTIRRVSFVLTAQRIGLSLDEIANALAALPSRRTPSRRDWSRVAATWLPLLDERITALQQLRSRLDGCIGLAACRSTPAPCTTLTTPPAARTRAAISARRRPAVTTTV
jgi:MerR family transcriptional regulator, redox-sensitive transcriptional activator SoxR